MVGTVQLQVSIDETTREHLRQYAGTGPAGTGWIIAKLIEAGLGQRKRLLTGINRRFELATLGKLEEHDRAGAVPVPIDAKAALDLANLAPAFDQTSPGMAGLIIKVVLADKDWTAGVLSTAISAKIRPR